MLTLFFLNSCSKSSCPSNSKIASSSKNTRLKTPFFSSTKLSKSSGGKSRSGTTRNKPPRIKSNFKSRAGLLR
jgi:hypothetical protein